MHTCVAMFSLLSHHAYQPIGETWSCSVLIRSSSLPPGLQHLLVHIRRYIDSLIHRPADRSSSSSSSNSSRMSHTQCDTSSLTTAFHAATLSGDVGEVEKALQNISSSPLSVRGKYDVISAAIPGYHGVNPLMHVAGECRIAAKFWKERGAQVAAVIERLAADAARAAAAHVGVMEGSPAVPVAGGMGEVRIGIWDRGMLTCMRVSRHDMSCHACSPRRGTWAWAPAWASTSRPGRCASGYGIGAWHRGMLTCMRVSRHDMSCHACSPRRGTWAWAPAETTSARTGR
jgi:hypothetical protein